MSKFIFTLAAVVTLTHCCAAQGFNMQVQLQTFPTPDTNSALALFSVPTPSSDPSSLQTVSYDITINSESLRFLAGRIAGGSTAWAWDLGNPTVTNGITRYFGSTEMLPFALNDMLAGRTGFELVNGEIQLYMGGSIVPVPEPSAVLLGTLAAVSFALFRNPARQR